MSNGLTRRELFLMGNALALPTLLGRLDASLEAAAAAGPLVAGPQIYQSIGVEPVINCRGTFTIIGGSVERPEVRAAMDAAARHFVQIDELADAVGRRFAELTGAEWGMVSAGCAAGLKHVTVACVTGGNPEKLIRIPDLSGLDKTEVIVPRSSRNVYDHAIRNVGVRMVTVESIEELERAINPRTAMIYLMADSGPNAMLEAGGTDRRTEEHSHPRRCGRRSADDSQRAPAARRHHRRLQRRQGHLRSAVRGAAARTEGHPAVRLAGQRAASRPRARQQSGTGGDARHAGGGRSVGEARSRGRMENLARLAGHDLRSVSRPSTA